MSQPLRPYLEAQADRIEMVLSAHRAPGHVTGGTVGPRLVRFFLTPAPEIRYAKIRRLVDDLALALRVPTLRIDRGTEGVVLEFPHPQPRPVRLLPLLEESAPLPAATALLGLTEEGLPLLARLSSPEVAHVLVAGTTGSGKSVLLRAIALSLVLSHPPGALRLLCLDPKGRAFRCLAGAPHLLRPPVTALPEVVEALGSLLRVMELRDERGENAPRIVVLVDELADLIMTGESEVSAALTRLAQRGREAGIHLVAATQRPSSAILSGMLRANFPLRLVGKVASTHDAQVAAGRGGTDAHLLTGRGDFLAVGSTAQPLRFQAAHVKEEEAREAVRGLRRQRVALPTPRSKSYGITREQGW
jgi:S-DNA-T family DNA segregation ATPase FtsK/SpoIIIE